MATFDKYTPDINPDLINPERGMYSAATPNFGDEDDEGLLPEQVNYHTIVPEWLWLAPCCKEDLVWDPTNPQDTVLNKYAKKLEDARKAGYKILFRPRYDKESDPGRVSDDCKYLIDGEPVGEPVFHADSLARQKNHIEAVAAMLGDYKDVIAFIQAGYLGNWGEWNDADYDKDNVHIDYDNENVPLLYTRPDRRDIIDHVLSTYAAEGITQDVELRRPVFAKEVVVRDASANVGLHNDCFMSSDNISNEVWPEISGDDSGTYSHFFDFLTFSDLTASSDQQNLSTEPGIDLETVEDARKWAEERTENSSFGGETCPSNGNERWRFCTNMTGNDMTGVTSEPASLHMNYLNHDYATFPDPAAEDGTSSAVDVWQKGGCYDEIRLRLGYRFEVTCVEYPETVSAGETFSVAVDVENTGWARLHKPRDAKLVLRNGATSHGPYTFSDGPPVSDWAPGQPAETITATVAAGGDPPPPPPGTYRVRLWIPDPDLLEFLSTAPNPEDYEKAKTHYAVRLATLRDGVNVFDPETAENDLGVEIAVQ